MYTAFYELRQEPFHVTPDPDFLFPSPSHKEALAAIIYGIEQRKGFVAITGEVGVGKTTILRSYLDFADRKDLKLVYVYNSDLSFDELVTTLLQELGVAERPASTFMAVSRLHEALIEIYRNNQTVVLIIDEAQNMPIETLESLRMLSNLETVTEKLIQIMLIGQPEFDEMLQQHRLRQLRQRIAIHARIGALNLEDSIAYLDHRLNKVAAGTKPVFTRNALRLIAEAAEGIPRNLNILSDNALITGFGYQMRPVNTKIVKEVLADRQLGPAERVPTNRPKAKWIGAGAAATAAAAIAILFVLRAEMPHRSDVQVAQPGEAPGAAGEPAESLDRAIVRFGSWVDGVLQPGGGPSGRPEAPPRPQQDGAASRTATAPPPVVSPPAPSNPAEARPGVKSAAPPEPPKPPPVTERAAVPRPPVQAENPAPAPAPLAAPATRVETARADPAPPLAPRPPEVRSPPAALTPPPVAEPAPPPARSGAVETPPPANPARGASAPRRNQPIPLAAPDPPSPRPVTPRLPPRSTPSIAAAPAPPPPSPATTYSMAVPSVVPPSASGSGAAASGAGAEFTGRRIAAPTTAGRSDQLVRTVRAGDSLWTMAEDVYGYVNPNVLRRVQDANPHIRNINLLAPGQDVVFPRVPEAPSDAGLALYGSLPSTGGN